METALYLMIFISTGNNSKVVTKAQTVCGTTAYSEEKKYVFAALKEKPYKSGVITSSSKVKKTVIITAEIRTAACFPTEYSPRKVFPRVPNNKANKL